MTTSTSMLSRSTVSDSTASFIVISSKKTH
jgi:hypothetical protein